MSDEDKVSNKAEEFKGQAKEKFGQATGDDEMQAEGEKDQDKSKLKQAGENIKDAFKS